MVGFADAIRAHKAKAMGNAHAIVRETIQTFAESLVTTSQFNGPWTPYGDPALWKHPPPADYRPGNLRSSWFLALGEPSTERTDATDILRVNGLERMGDKPAGQRIYVTNSADHASSIEAGHSMQAPVGIMSVGEAEFSPMVYSTARSIVA